MQNLIIVFITVIEIALCYLTISRDSNLLEWRLGRLLANAGEVVLFLILLFFPGIDFSLRFKLFFTLLIVRLVFAGIIYHIKRDESNKKKKTIGKIMSAIVSIVVLSISLIPAYIFADYNGLKTTGQYKVGNSSAILVDESRLEEFEDDGSNREVPIYFYYPVTDVKKNAMVENEKYPVVFFSHGAFGYNKSNYSTYEELASNGYIVISMEHPYHAFFTKDTNGNTITVDPTFIQNSMNINSENITEEEIFEITKPWIDLRVEDADFVIDSIKHAVENHGVLDCFVVDNKEVTNRIIEHIDVEKMGFMGHSLGGATATTIGRNRADISAVVDIDGTMLGEVIGVEDGKDIIREGDYTTPILSFDNEEHYTERKACIERDEVYVNNIVLSQAKDGFNTHIDGSGHMNYTDLPLFSPVLASSLGTGDVDAEKCILKTNEIILQFFNCYLKNQGTFTVEEGYAL